jgi:hypothetical protein
MVGETKNPKKIQSELYRRKKKNLHSVGGTLSLKNVT